MSASELAERIRERHGNRPIVVMGIGLPGTGKTELLRPLAEELNPTALYLSRTAVKQSILQEAPDLDGSSGVLDRRVWARLYSSTGEYLKAGGSVIVDATHTGEGRREKSVSQYYRRGAKGVVAAYFTVSHVDIAFGRLENAVNHNDFTSMVERLRRRPPTLHEGFSDVIELNSDEIPSRLVGAHGSQ